MGLDGGASERRGVIHAESVLAFIVMTGRAGRQAAGSQLIRESYSRDCRKAIGRADWNDQGAINKIPAARTLIETRERETSSKCFFATFHSIAFALLQVHANNENNTIYFYSLWAVKNEMRESDSKHSNWVLLTYWLKGRAAKGDAQLDVHPNLY